MVADPCLNGEDGKVQAEVELQILTCWVSFQHCLRHIPVPEFEKGLPLATFVSSNKISLIGEMEEENWEMEKII